MQQQQGELLRSLTNAEKADSKQSGEHSKLTERVEIENSPIVLIGNSDGDWFGVVGNHRVTDIYGSREQAEEKINRKDWDTITNIIAIIAEKIVDRIMMENIIANNRAGE
jgi:hypothetical protein